MNKPKILVVIDWFLPGTNSGGPVRSIINLIGHLENDFDLFIVTRNSDFGSRKPYPEVIPNQWTDFSASTEVYYISREQLNRRHLKQIFSNKLFDVVYINGMYSWYFSILPLILLKSFSKKVIVAPRGMLNPQAFSVKPMRKRLFLTIAKRFKLYQNIVFHATSNDEETYIKIMLGSKSNVKIAPNLLRPQTDIQKRQKIKHTPTKFINLARISIEKGTLVMLKALENITEHMVLDIYGPIHDINYWKLCKKVIETLPIHICVTYKGPIQGSHVPNLLNNYDFFVLLSEGENFGHAIIEALSAGCPVLISKNTPWKDLKRKQIGWDIETSEKETITRTLENCMVMSENNYKQWSLKAREFADNVRTNTHIVSQSKSLLLNYIN
jgi:glycosyltransferase involved in cell wall biosynthesis